MMKRASIILITATAMTCAARGVGDPPAPGAAPPQHPAKSKVKHGGVQIATELSCSTAYPGDPVRLTELVALARNIRARSARHIVYILGQYDFSTGFLSNRDPAKALYSGTHVFDDCDWSGILVAAGDKPLRFNTSNPRQEGIEFQFKARQLGIYLIKAEWTLYGTNEVVESNPVILTVQPPLDKRGKTIIREEWVDPIEWKYRPK